MYGVYDRERNTSERDYSEALADISRDSLLLRPKGKYKKKPNHSLFVESSEDCGSSTDEDNKMELSDSPAWDYNEMEPSKSKVYKVVRSKSKDNINRISEKILQNRKIKDY